MKNTDLMIGLAVGLAAGALSTGLMRRRRPNVRSAVAHVIGDLADSVSKNMNW